MEFLDVVRRIVVAQACTEFDGIRSGAADALADMIGRYIVELGQLIHENAETAGRTNINIDDVYPAFLELGVSFPELARLYCTVEEPFALSLPERFPLQRKPKFAPSIAEGGFGGKQKMPTFLPVFPDTHTFYTSLETHQCQYKQKSSEFQAVCVQDREFLANDFLKRKTLQVQQDKEFGSTWGSLDQKINKDTCQAQGVPFLKGGLAMQRMLAYADRKLHIKTSQTEKYGGHKPVEPQLFRTHSSYDNADYVKADRIISGDACYE